MRIERLSNGRVEDFLNYCRIHKGAVDSSFLYEDDLKQFQDTEENPTYLAIDENGKVKAAAPCNTIKTLSPLMQTPAEPSHFCILTPPYFLLSITIQHY
ncbi:hypothetical protein ACOSZF_21880 [Cytobacillus firmus]|uniref:Uncharacterized protein n=1 Tax=Cytobacillus firmus TaxID=1399 RepID=A0A800MV24_CYTFI|nr:hypothetical protein [Cytobacillus firmus]KAF0822957.1 hypothetical protein KIS1582_3201 [Cytobacillus firmus]MBG9546931.1 hypothetical protein [Cytobacillus firmus]MBG9603542.1 hypothetical protein [Cytobacillus firmus]MBG9656477.1 hypothetical protein [Cytobacillus firmus]MDD9313829.1 hypothetical protein [Cytobacillus firmus]